MVGADSFQRGTLRGSLRGTLRGSLTGTLAGVATSDPPPPNLPVLRTILWDVKEFMIVMVNSEEVQHGSDLTQWLTAKTLGVQSTCFSTTKMVVAGENFLGFRVMGEGVMMKITHVLWEAGAS